MPTSVTIAPSFASTTLGFGSAGTEVKRVQQRLTDLGYALGEVDGEFGTLTRGAVLAFQADNQLEATGTVDAAMLAALPLAKPRPLSEARKAATADDLRALGSGTVRLGDWIKRLGIGTGAVGGLGLLDANTSIVSKLLGFGAAPEAAATTAAVASGGLGALLNVAKIAFSASTGGTGAIALALAPVIFQVGQRIIARRVADHQSGKNLGK